MLALFKESAVKLMNKETGAIVPFHRFYDALENFLDHSHRGVIIKAYDNSYINPEKKDSEVFAVNVLKTLFMIKYVLEITANIDNITSLMIENIDDDRIELKGRVEDALKVLMRQMLVQKNGELYVFLTDEEQEINREIDSQNVEMAEVINKVSEMIFEDIFTDKKYRYPAFGGRYSFAFNQVVDDRPYKSNQNYDVGLRILTPWYDGGWTMQLLRMMSGQGREVLVVLPNDAAFLDELRVYLKIEKFLRLNTSTQLTKYESHTILTLLGCWEIQKMVSSIMIYYNLPEEAILLDHSDFTGVPKCTSWDDNYFVKENMFFDSMKELEAELMNRIRQGQKMFYFKMSKNAG